jgi:hypothetical protein
MVNSAELLAALRVIARADRDDFVRLIRAHQMPVPIRRRDSARNMAWLVLDHVGGQKRLDFAVSGPERVE